ncbi:unnamed protein product [Diatraea saccharalis]|uniref:Acyltransferase 3 domain-containing protein n=1 Tax=Diatraea saccharalis TaxID=40085 RepID=A0A9N9R4P6_9NEOP|nr:unnamed protein product [Diatraea saccharalis]
MSVIYLKKYFYTFQCLMVTWYIPCDFHFYVIAVIVFVLYKRCRRLGKVIFYALAAASLIIPGVINYVNGFHPIQLFTYEFLWNKHSHKQFYMFYIKSHNRAAAYIVGFIAGCLFNKYRPMENFKLTQAKSLIYVFVGFIVMVLTAFLGVSYQHRNYSQLEGTLYVMLNRPVWAVGVAIIILTCCFGKVPLVNSFLEWYPWVPLSRLAYGIYLVHYIIIIRNVGISRQSLYYDNFNIVSFH